MTKHPRQDPPMRIPPWAEVLAKSAWQEMDAALGLLGTVNDAFGARCPWDLCSTVDANGYMCPLGDFTQAGIVTVADHLRSYSHLMRTATPALTAFTVLRATVETSASLAWTWSEDSWEGRHHRAILCIRHEVVTFTAGGSADPKHRYPSERFGLDPNDMLSLLNLSTVGSAPKPTRLMKDIDAEDLYGVLSGAAHGSREVVGLVVQDTADGGQEIVPHRRLSELTWKDAEEVIHTTLAQLRENLLRQ